MLACWNPRDFATDNYRTVDDRPYGGGPGMVMMAEPLAARRSGAARRAARGGGREAVVLLSPQGRRLLDHARVAELARRRSRGWCWWPGGTKGSTSG